MRQLPEPWLTTYEERREAIAQRLGEFSDVQPSAYFYELAYCILTPQSSARNAEATIAELKRDHFFEEGFDPTGYLRDPKHYIRFHNVKAKRLLNIREHFAEIKSLLLDRPMNPARLRDLFMLAVGGMGMKESSHFLRNIGVTSLAILDRHIYKHLTRLGIISEPPKSGPNRKRYLEIEAAWHAYAIEVGISLDELDLLFWSMETGEILK